MWNSIDTVQRCDKRCVVVVVGGCVRLEVEEVVVVGGWFRSTKSKVEEGGEGRAGRGHEAGRRAVLGCACAGWWWW